MMKLFLLMLFGFASQAWGQPAGSMDVHWNEGAPDCAATPQNPLQVHAYEPPLAKTVLESLPDEDGAKIPLVVSHSHAVDYLLMMLRHTTKAPYELSISSRTIQSRMSLAGTLS